MILGLARREALVKEKDYRKNIIKCRKFELCNCFRDPYKHNFGHSEEPSDTLVLLVCLLFEFGSFGTKLFLDVLVAVDRFQLDL